MEGYLSGVAAAVDDFIYYFLRISCCLDFLVLFVLRTRRFTRIVTGCIIVKRDNIIFLKFLRLLFYCTCGAIHHAMTALYQPNHESLFIFTLPSCITNIRQCITSIHLPHLHIFFINFNLNWSFPCLTSELTPYFVFCAGNKSPDVFPVKVYNIQCTDKQ